MKIVIKVGTQAILSEDGTPFEEIMLSLVNQISELQKNHHQVILVSSGAVGSGRKTAREILKKEYGSSIAEKQVLASLGQHELIHIYAKMFKKQSLLASQLLLTKQDFQTRSHYLNISRLLEEILKQKNIIPIINENDTVAIEELMFTDNDELAGLIASQINADKLIILSNVEGVYNKHPSLEDAIIIPIIDPKTKNWPEASPLKSTLGRGGMISKLTTSHKMSELGITTHIASINQSNIITRIINNETIGTTILAHKKKSNIKRWIAFNTDKEKGSIKVNICLFNILQENQKILSLLPVGIESYSGNFQKGDLIEILSPTNQKIGIGIAKYSSDKLKEYLGVKNKPEFIHYDYLHIFERS